MGVEQGSKPQKSLYEELLEYTTPRNAEAYTEHLSKKGIRSLYEVLKMDISDLKDFPPHLRHVLRQARGEEVGLLEGTPLEGVEVLDSWVNILFGVLVAIVAAYFLGFVSLYSFFERMMNIAVLVMVMGLLLIRSFCLLFLSEDLGVLEVHREYEGAPDFTVTVTELRAGEPVRTLTKRTTGENVGVVTYQIILAPALNFIGLNSRLAWTSVVGIKEGDSMSQHHTAVALTPVNKATWRSLERLPWIPGIRSIQRSVVFKSAPCNSAFTVKKNASGQVWLEQGSSLKKRV